MYKFVLAATLMALTTGPVLAQPEASDSAAIAAREPGIPIAKLIAVVAKKTGKKFVVDPRVRADPTIVGQDPGALSFNDLLIVLAVHGFVAVEDGGYVLVVPDANMRTLPTPTIGDRESRPAGEPVTRVITLKGVSAPALVPVLRPLLPQYAHLAAIPCANQLLITDRYSNVRRLEEIIRAIDTGSGYKPPGCNDADHPSTK